MNPETLIDTVIRLTLMNMYFMCIHNSMCVYIYIHTDLGIGPMHLMYALLGPGLSRIGATFV